MHKMLPQIHHNPGWHDCAKGKKGVKAQKEAHVNELQAIPTEIEVTKQTKNSLKVNLLKQQDTLSSR
jgi:hypothetical protein